MTDGTTDFIHEMNLQQARGSIRALSDGSTTFLRALKDVELAGRSARAVRRINDAINALPDNNTSGFFKVAGRLLREGMGDPLSISLDAEVFARSRGIIINFGLSSRSRY